MKQVQAYRCEHCGKTYLRPHACREHEENRCSRNPEIRPYCYSCEHYKESFPDTEKERITYSLGIDYYGDEEYDIKLFSPNQCLHPDNPCKLYNNINLSEEMRQGLSEAGYRPMPCHRT